MHNHLPRIDPTRSLDGGHRARESERAALRRRHGEHIAAERARVAAQPRGQTFPERLISGPAAAILALLAVRRPN